jgi:hypothetical protein
MCGFYGTKELARGPNTGCTEDFLPTLEPGFLFYLVMQVDWIDMIYIMPPISVGLQRHLKGKLVACKVF